MVNVAAVWAWVLFLALCFGTACQERQEPVPDKTEDQQTQSLPSGKQIETDGSATLGSIKGPGEFGEITLAPEALKGRFIETVKVDRRKIQEGIQATANIRPNRYKLAHVSPRIEGKAVKVHGELGDKVKAGETLAVLDSIELGYKKSALRQARTALQVTKAHYEREKRLFEQGVSSEKDYLEARGEYQKNLAAFQAAVEGLELVGLTHEEIRAIIKKNGDHHPLSAFALTAPQSGTIIERHITPGELITPDEKPFTIADLTTVWILVDIYEKDLAAIREGADVRLTVDAYPDDVFQGKVVYLGNLVNPETRTVEARVEIPNPDGRLRPGMFARATLAGKETNGRPSLVVPQEAIQYLEDRTVVFVEKRTGAFEPRNVTVGVESGSSREILTGVQEGERVVTQGAFYLKSILQGEKLGGHGH